MNTLQYTRGTVLGEAAEGRNGNHKVSERELLSLGMLAVSLGALTMALLGGAWLVPGIFNDSSGISFTAAIVLGLAYLVGWLTALIAIRVYGSLVLPIIIHIYAWGYLLAVCGFYMLIMTKLFTPDYQTAHDWAYLMIVAAGFGAMVGLHLIVEDHNLRPFSIPLLIIILCQLGLMVYRYVIPPEPANPSFLWRDLLYFFLMTAFSVLMLAHVRILTPLRNRLTTYFDKNFVILRSEE